MRDRHQKQKPARERVKISRRFSSLIFFVSAAQYDVIFLKEMGGVHRLGTVVAPPHVDTPPLLPLDTKQTVIIIRHPLRQFWLYTGASVLNFAHYDAVSAVISTISTACQCLEDHRIRLHAEQSKPYRNASQNPV